MYCALALDERYSTAQVGSSGSQAGAALAKSPDSRSSRAISHPESVLEVDDAVASRRDAPDELMILQMENLGVTEGMPLRRVAPW